jgi:hypothetical protein
MHVRPLDLAVDLDSAIEVVHRAFATVAAEFGYTPQTAPTFPAFIPASNLAEMVSRGAIFFGAFDGGALAGTVAIEPAHDDLFYLERLAVLPEYRHSGAGSAHGQGVRRSPQLGGRRVSIAVVDENVVLKDWYLRTVSRSSKQKLILISPSRLPS